VGFISLLRPDDPAGPVGSVGRLVSGLEGQVADADYRPLPTGSVGPLGFRAPWIPDRYVGNEKATAEHFRDGWFYPGDVGAIDADGWVSLDGRSDDVINFGGVKIQPESLEAVLAEHPDIQDAAVVGAPHPTAGSVPVALVVLRRPVAPTALMVFCKSRIDASRLPAAIVPVPEIFRSAEGKILRHRLLEAYKLVASS
jgi:acyl-CoA synthetase (AMP-forming)/AMP-acid ligase II